ncbi:MAG TPA: sugar phosphate isomerase/epimerase [Phycisphaerae bacterium]|nr:sugar phosphate isomerase/epimerase [Phycisphaerae bacterium]
MRLAFMSSVCPKMTLAELLAAGEAHGYEGIEFRPEWDHAHGVELPSTAARRREAAGLLADSPLEGCCLSPGTRFCKDAPGERDAELEKLSRYIDLAAEVGISRIRVFADPLPSVGARARTASYEAQADYLARGAERAAAAGVRLVLETHSNFRAFDAGEVLYRAGYPAGLWINWHLGHCLRHGEGVDEAYRHVKGRVAHCHFSLGEDKVDHAAIERQAELLRDDGFDGFFSVEVINPDDGPGVLARHAEGWKQLKDALGL